ncbi:MAG: hypothetical protein GXY76_01330 [Chloroflexi bacterium]|nr:hypothetical protein [Chloroflexota bacterium]
MPPPQVRWDPPGALKVDEQRYTQSVIVHPKGVDLSWPKHQGRSLTGKTIKAWLERYKPEVLIIGLGAGGAKLALTRKAIARLEAAKVEWHALPTRRACERYQELGQEKRIVAALHLGE